MARLIILILVILLTTFSIISYALTKSVLPWSFIDGLYCPLTNSDCVLSLKNFNYYYWINKAIKNKNIDLCDNITGKETLDLLGASRNSAVYDCKVVYIIKTEEIDLCLTSAYYRNSCLPGLAKRLKKIELCDDIVNPEDKAFEERQIDVCKDNIINNHSNSLITF